MNEIVHRKGLLVRTIQITGILLGLGMSLAVVRAQTTLGGNHVITGALQVGDSLHRGTLQVKGPTGGAAGMGSLISGDGGGVFEGTFGIGQLPATTAGPRFLWHPKKGAFRAGRLGADWNEGSVGVDSVALGNGSAASGANASALGGGNAEGEASVAVGIGTMTGPYSAAMSGSRACGFASTAISLSFIGEASFYCTAASEGEAYGVGGSAFSGGMVTSRYSVAIGPGAWNPSAYSVVLGTNPLILPGHPDEWIDSDPLLVVGNGNPRTYDENGHPVVPETRSNALEVYKNGNVHIPKRQGDILMGEFVSGQP